MRGSLGASYRRERASRRVPRASSASRSKDLGRTGISTTHRLRGPALISTAGVIGGSDEAAPGAGHPSTLRGEHHGGLLPTRCPRHPQAAAHRTRNSVLRRLYRVRRRPHPRPGSRAAPSRGSPRSRRPKNVGSWSRRAHGRPTPAPASACRNDEHSGVNKRRYAASRLASVACKRGRAASREPGRGSTGRN